MEGALSASTGAKLPLRVESRDSTGEAKRGLIVEFLGSPGSGKSTIAKETVRLLKASEVNAHETYEKWNSSRSARLADLAGSLLDATLSRPGLLAATWTLAGAFAKGATGDRAKTALHWLSRCGHYQRARRSPGVHLIDQGVLQAYWSLVFAGHDAHLATAWDRLEEARSHSDVVVVVSAQRDTIRARLEARPGTTSRLERALDDSEAALQRSEDALSWVVEHIRSDGRIRLLLEVNNDLNNGIQLAAARVADKLKAHYVESSDL